MSTVSSRPSPRRDEGTSLINPYPGLELPAEIYANAYNFSDRFARLQLPQSLTNHEIAFSLQGLGDEARLFLLKPDMGMTLVGDRSALSQATRMIVAHMGSSVAIDLNFRSFLLCHYWLTLNGLSEKSYPAKIHIRLDSDPFGGPIGLGVVRTWSPTSERTRDGRLGWCFDGDNQHPRTSFTICGNCDLAQP